MGIKDYGWNEYFESEWSKRSKDVMLKVPDLLGNCNNCSHMRPGRIIADYGQILRVVDDDSEFSVNRPVNKNQNEKDMQIAVGDWVALEGMPDGSSVCIRFVLQRKTKFSRAAAGPEVKEQILAANVDTVFIIQSLNKDFNMRRLERYLIAAWESGATPVVVLNKSDCCTDVADKIAIVNSTSSGVEVHAISCVTGDGIEEIRKYFVQGKTVALLGSSGVGKSTLANTLAGEELLKTQTIREDDARGRHTTTHRELVLLPGGGLILDTPGMRALSLWKADTGMEIMFGDIEELIKICRFHNCKHQNEPGCAVREALDTEQLEMKRWESWLKLQKELAYIESKKEGKLHIQQKQWGKQLSKFEILRANDI